jgi:hypothetical protein
MFDKLKASLLKHKKHKPVAGAQDGPKPKVDDPMPKVDDPKPKVDDPRPRVDDLWDRAYIMLREGKDTAKLMESYDKILRLRNEKSTVGSSEREERMAMLVHEKVDEMDKDQWKFNIGDKEIVVGEQVDRIVKCVLFAKDFVSQTISADPHAALAWAGVCILLPVSYPKPSLFQLHRPNYL